MLNTNKKLNKHSQFLQPATITKFEISDESGLKGNLTEGHKHFKLHRSNTITIAVHGTRITRRRHLPPPPNCCHAGTTTVSSLPNITSSLLMNSTVTLSLLI